MSKKRFGSGLSLRLGLVALSSAIGLTGCSEKTAPYIERLRSEAPSNSWPAAIPTHGPFQRPVLAVGSGNGQLAIATEDASGKGYSIWVSGDLQSWGNPIYSPGLPSSLAPLNRLYWTVDDTVMYISGSPFPQNLPAPAEGAPIGTFTVDNQLGGYFANGSLSLVTGDGWSTTAPLAQAISSSSRQQRGLCGAQPANHVISIAAGFPGPTLAELSKSSGVTIQSAILFKDKVVAASDHELFQGDAVCTNLKPIPHPASIGTVYGITSLNDDFYAATQSGLYRFSHGSWASIESNVTGSLIRKLRWIDGTLYAAHSGGLAKSKNYGETWARSEAPLDVSSPVNDVIKFRGALYAVTDNGLFSKQPTGGSWQSVPLPAEIPHRLTGIAASGDLFLTVASGVWPDASALHAWVLDADHNRWTESKELAAAGSAQSLSTVNGRMFAATSTGLYRFDPDQRRWEADQSQNLPTQLRAVSAFDRRGLLVLGADNSLWTTTDADSPKPKWTQFLNTSQVRNLGWVTFDAWSNPKVHPDTFLASNNNQFLFNYPTGIVLFSPNRPAFRYSYSLAAIESDNQWYLFVGTDAGVSYIERREPNSSFIFLIKGWFHNHSDDWWFWPINVGGSFLSAYIIALACIIVRLYLPIHSGWVGTGWLVTQIAKPLTISPKLGRWLIFLGYRVRLLRAIKIANPPADIAQFTLEQVQRDAAQSVAGTTPLPDLDRLLQSANVVILEHSQYPEFGEYLARLIALRAIRRGALEDCLPILIPRGYWKGDTPSSASEVLKSLYAVPTDSGDVLRGQMENGGLIFIVEAVDELEKQDDLLLEMFKLKRSSAYPRCYFALLSTSVVEALQSSDLPLYRLVLP
jgi:hypothetical protein